MMIIFYYHTKILNNFLCRSRLKSESLSVTYCDMTCQTKGEHILDSEREHIFGNVGGMLSLIEALQSYWAEPPNA